jgi:probable addiction module antidote protein
MTAAKRKVKTKRWDSAAHLSTATDVVAYLNAAMAEGGDNPAFLAHALGVAARARNISQLARDAGMTRAGLYRALSVDGNPSFATVAKVARALGYRLLLEPVR